MASIRLRCRTSDGRQLTLDQLTDSSQVSDLLDRIYSTAQIGRDHELLVKWGYPPKPLDLSKPGISLASIGLTSGESLIVESRRNAELERARIQELDTALTGQSSAECGFLSVVSIPSNNSCLFLAIDYCVSRRGSVDLEAAAPMRVVIAQAVASDPSTYTEALLERSNPAYCQWIQSPNSWGGAIELSILCRKLGVQICVIDTQTGRIDSYPAAEATDKIYLLYDGIHYDAIAMESPVDGQLVTRFPLSDEAVHVKAEELGREAKSAGQFTDMSKFQLRCASCKVYLRGEAEARQHAKTTGHADFTETRGS